MYACACLFRVVHSRDMTFRGVHMDKVLVTGNNRARISSAGVMDVLEADSKISLVDLQVSTTPR